MPDIIPSASGGEQHPNPNPADSMAWLRTEAAKPVCQCGDPRCVYVKNLVIALENLPKPGGAS